MSDVTRLVGMMMQNGVRQANLWSWWRFNAARVETPMLSSVVFTVLLTADRTVSLSFTRKATA